VKGRGSKSQDNSWGEFWWRTSALAERCGKKVRMGGGQIRVKKKGGVEEWDELVCALEKPRGPTRMESNLDRGGEWKERR